MGSSNLPNSNSPKCRRRTLQSSTKNAPRSAKNDERKTNPAAARRCWAQHTLPHVHSTAYARPLALGFLLQLLVFGKFSQQSITCPIYRPMETLALIPTKILHNSVPSPNGTLSHLNYFQLRPQSTRNPAIKCPCLIRKLTQTETVFPCLNGHTHCRPIDLTATLPAVQTTQRQSTLPSN